MPLYTDRHSFQFNIDFSLDIQFPLPSSFQWIYFCNPLRRSLTGIRYVGNKKQNVKLLNDIFRELEGYLKIRNMGAILNNNPRFQFLLQNIDYPYNDLRTFCKMNMVDARGNKFELLLRLYISVFRRSDRLITIIPALIKRGPYRSFNHNLITIQL